MAAPLATDRVNPALRRVADQVRAAGAEGAKLRIRGAGTKDFYGNPPRGRPLDTTELTGITSYEPSELVVTVRAGTPLAELEAALAECGQCLPFEPPSFGVGGTVGGMVASGLSGPARASVGAVRDHVLGASLINGRGDLLSFGGQVMKNVAGYDVSRVLAGSLGTLGLIAEVSLKVMPVAPAEATLSFDCSQADALRLLNAWGGQPLPLNASRWMPTEGASDEVSDQANDGPSGSGGSSRSGGSSGGGGSGSGGGMLWLRLRGAGAAVAAACAQLGGTRHDDAQAQADWQDARHLALPWFDLRGGLDLWRLSVPQTAPVLAIRRAPMIEWHGGQRWYFAHADEGPALRAAAATAGGHATLFMSSSAQAVNRFDALSPPLARIHRALMNEFDPHAVLDRGRLFPVD